MGCATIQGLASGLRILFSQVPANNATSIQKKEIGSSIMEGLTSRLHMLFTPALHVMKEEEREGIAAVGA